MKKILFIFLVNTIYTGYSQCNSSTIFGNTISNAVCFEVNTNVRTCYTNDLPNHAIGNSFPSGNVASAQSLTLKMCAYPEKSAITTTIYGPPSSLQGCSNYYGFGVGMNGILYSPFGARWFVNPNTMQENTNWNIEPVVQFNMDLNGGHINPSGEYHYHTIAHNYFTDSLQIDGTTHSPIVGYAADGFPIYYKYVYSNPNNTTSNIIGLTSGYSLKTGNRPGNGIVAPNGSYDGLYIEDYEYLNSNWDLDSCNGRFGITPEYPTGTYYYVLTDNWPYIPRCFYGKHVDNTFRVGGNCPGSTANQDCASFTSINTPLTNVKVNVTPNPSSETIYIDIQDLQFLKNIVDISFYDLSGKIWFQTNDKIEKFNVYNFPKGIYFLQLSTNKKQLTQKVIIN